MLILVAGRVDLRTRWGATDWIHLLGGTDVRIDLPAGNAIGVAVGLLLGRRSCTVGVVGLAIARVRSVCCGGGSSICLIKGLKGGLLCWLLAWTVMLYGDILVFIVRSVVFKDNKRNVTSRVPLMNGSHQSYSGWRCGIM